MPALPNLATQLNDLAVANQDGLLNDDEYRLLRQNLFERYSGGVEILSVSSTPVLKPVLRPVAAKAPSSRRKHVELVEQTPLRPTVRSKTSGVAGFFRKATGRKLTGSPPINVIKLSLPRLFSRKAEPPPPSDTDSSVTRSSSFSRKASSGDLESRPPESLPASPTLPKAEPTSPTHSNLEPPLQSPLRSAVARSRHDVIPGGSNDTFDDENLQTSDAIRKAIAAVEAEGRRLVAAFNDLETSAAIRYSQEHQPRHRSGSSSALRRPAATPLTTPSGNSSYASSKQRPPSNAHSDVQSIRSNSSLRTSKSIGALSQSTPPQSSSAWSALSPRRLPSLRHKGSLTSVSSQGTGSFLGARAATGLSRSASAASRSTGHLPLPLAPASSGGTMMELLNCTPMGEGGEELAEVRRRRAEMTGRCEARLEYLRAKLKGAELHEKLLKK
ncbi:hypothetical protein B0H15DRAFT_808268 [Mycena belliarum]|uniref:Uncharacterized protein n=1 Tax=Mycena belliarum TaxID=1033014 RepID=A0AAD6XUN9_9AGAR|nr:hypothetical protein B0H15DRAFT_808268 [Mycena belliae]